MCRLGKVPTRTRGTVHAKNHRQDTGRKPSNLIPQAHWLTATRHRWPDVIGTGDRMLRNTQTSVRLQPVHRSTASRTLTICGIPQHRLSGEKPGPPRPDCATIHRATARSSRCSAVLQGDPNPEPRAGLGRMIVVPKHLPDRRSALDFQGQKLDGQSLRAAEVLLKQIVCLRTVSTRQTDPDGPSIVSLYMAPSSVSRRPGATAPSRSMTQ